jgi:DNA processing protein
MNVLSIDQIILHLSLLDGIGPVTIGRICECMQQYGSLQQLYTISAADLVHHVGLSPAQAQIIIKGLADTGILEQELLYLMRNGINWSVVGNDQYPSLLSHIYAPPTILYWRGTLPDAVQTCIAIVGSRDANAYGQRIVSNFIPPLVQAGCCIVSGGARGIDTKAHQIAVEAGGTTVVVLGSGLARPYPASNIRLFEAIIDAGGALVSAFPVHTQALPGNFPARNRIIAGLSHGTVVVQAAEQSGARITAQYALDQGREVCAVPGSIDDPLSQGCHDLISQGATLVTKPEDILSLFGKSIQSSRAASPEIQHARMVSQAENPVTISAYPVTIEDTIIAFCNKPQSLDDLAVHSGMPHEQLTGILFDLQLNGKVEQSFSGKWHTRI